MAPRTLHHPIKLLLDAMGVAVILAVGGLPSRMHHAAVPADAEPDRPLVA